MSFWTWRSSLFGFYYMGLVGLPVFIIRGTNLDIFLGFLAFLLFGVDLIFRYPIGKRKEASE